MEYRRLRAPQQHGESLVEPPRSEAAELVRQNSQLIAAYEGEIHGRPLAAWIAAGRRELLARARAYTGRYRSAPALAPRHFVLTGHQPHLFHPGVWFKNFVVDSVAREAEAIAVNLLIDNDVNHASTLPVPAGTVDEPRREMLAVDGPRAEIPYEERGIVDRSLFESFADRVTETLAPLVRDPLIRRLWPRVLAAAKSTDNLGQCLSQGRHELEAEWGLATLEVPLSHLCDSTPFLDFAQHLLTELPRLHAVYNTSLAEYRRVNRVRSRSHPVPELAAEDDWREAPFWVWTASDPRRRRLFARRVGNVSELTDRAGWRSMAPVHELATSGIKVRPRALITTMFARLALSDLFVHGIGGAKYDQLTDAIIARFFGLQPPAYLVATATARLPIAYEPVSESQRRAVCDRLRDLEFHPERHVAITPATQLLVHEKAEWLASGLPSRRELHRAITSINSELQPFVAEQRRQLIAARQRLEQRQLRQRVLNSREYAYCLFPEATLRHLLLEKSSRET